MTETSWKLQQTCRVRKEAFGLLFYDSRGPKLLFAEAGPELSEEFFTEVACQSGQLAKMGNLEQHRITRFLTQLAGKGFLYEQSIC